MKTRIISVVSQKGGVGKTTLTFNLACALADKGYNVLVADLDAQCNLTSTCGGAVKHTICDLIFNSVLQRETSFDETINTASCGIDYIASSKILDSCNSQISLDSESPYVLKRIFSDSYFSKYDYIIFDNKTALDLLTQNALNASDYVILPVESGQYAFDGIDKIISKIKSLNATTNPQLRLMGILLNKTESRTNIGKEVARATESIYGNLIFDTRIPYRKTQIEKAITEQSGCVQLKNNTLGASFVKLAEEITERTGE